MRGCHGAELGGCLFLFFLFPSQLSPELCCFLGSLCCLELSLVTRSFLTSPITTHTLAARAPYHPLLLMRYRKHPQCQIKALGFLSLDPLCLRLLHILLKLKPVEAISSKATQITRNDKGEGTKAAKLQKTIWNDRSSVSGSLPQSMLHNRKQGRRPENRCPRL